MAATFSRPRGEGMKVVVVVRMGEVVVRRRVGK